jgi:integrase
MSKSPALRVITAEEVKAWNGKIEHGRGSLRLLPSGRVGARIKTADGSKSAGSFATCEEAYISLAAIRWPGDALGLVEAVTETSSRLAADGRWLPSTAHHREVVFVAHVLPLCRAVERARDDRQQRDQAVERWWSERRSTPTARVGAWKLYEQLVKEAQVRLGYVAADVTSPRNAKKAPAPQVRMPRSGESAAVEAAFLANPEHRWLWQTAYVARRTGMRFAEILGLCPDALDEKACTITVRRVQERPVYGAAGGTARNAPLRIGAKTSTSVRTLAVSKETMAELQSWCVGKGPKQPIIRTKTGSAPSSASASHILADVQRALNGGETFGWSWHSIRHEFLTRLGSTPGLSVKDVARAAGHSDIAVTARYLHADAARLATAMTALEFGS